MTGTNSHPQNACSRLRIERYFAHELDGRDAEQVERHMKECPACRSYFSILEDEKREFLFRHPFQTVADTLETKKRPWHRIVSDYVTGHPGYRPVFTAAVIVCILIPVLLAVSNMRRAPAVIPKGGEALSFICRRNGTVFPGSVRDTFFAGDKIQILYSSDKKQYLSLFSIDGSGAVTFYHPDTNKKECSILVEPGSNYYYPVSIVLDSSAGFELIAGIFTSHPIATTSIEGWARELVMRYGVTAVSNIEREIKTKPFGKKGIGYTLMLRKKRV